MPELSIPDIEVISADIRRAEITFSHLPEELLDHICCDVENEMKNGFSFYEAYEKVKSGMGPGRLKEIQKETLYAIDTKYRVMKNMMKISGITGTLMFGFAALFKIQHWPGAGPMMTLGAIILVFIFMPSALGMLWKETRSKNKTFLFISAFLTGCFFISGTLFKVQHWPEAGTMLSFSVLSFIFLFTPALVINRFSYPENKKKRPAYILGSVGMILFISGMLFKIQHWPWATLLMALGLIVLCLVAFPLYTWVTWKDEQHITPVFIYFVIEFLSILIPATLINLNLQHYFDSGFYNNLEQQKGMGNFLYSNNSKLVKSHRNSPGYPRMEELHMRTTDLLGIIGNIQVKMVGGSEKNQGKSSDITKLFRQTESGPEIQYYSISKPFELSPVRDFLLTSCTSRRELDSAMADYRRYVSGILHGDDIQGSVKMPESSDYLPGQLNGNEVVSMMSGLHSLELLKNSILTAEYQLLNNIEENAYSN